MASAESSREELKQKKLTDWEKDAVERALEAMGCADEQSLQIWRTSEQTRGNISTLLAGTEKPTGEESIALENLAWKDILETHEQFAAQAIRLGRNAGIPEPMLREFGRTFIKRQITVLHFDVIAGFLSGVGMEIVTPQQRELLLQLGREQTTLIEAELAAFEEMEAEEGVTLRLSPDATMEDFLVAFNALTRAERLILTDRIYDLPDQDVMERMMTMMTPEKLPEEEECILVRDFFMSVEGFDDILGIEWEDDE